MKTEVTEAGPFERTITVHLDEPDLARAKERAARKLSRSMKIKGFRPGKAPMSVVERMVGAAALRSEAIDEALPEVVTEAIAEAELRPVTTPRVKDIRDVDGGGVEVDVAITLWPKLARVPEVAGRRITIEAPVVEDDELSQQIDRLRSQFAELEEVEREADTGDFVMVNITTLVAGREIEEATASDLLYEVGSRSFIPGLDDLLVGVTPGSIKEGPGILPDGFGDHAGEEVVLRVLVKGVRAKKLPEVTDEWVSDVSEFETVAELEETIRDNLLDAKIHAAGEQFQSELIGQLVEELDVVIPEDLIEAEMEGSLKSLVANLERQNIDLTNYLRITGQSEQAFVDELRARADRVLKTRILLEGVIEREQMEVSDEELDGFYKSLLQGTEEDPVKVREAWTASGQGEVVAGDILRRKALERIMQEAEAIDAEGNPVDLSHVLGGDGSSEHGEPAPSDGPATAEPENDSSAEPADGQETSVE